MFKCEECGGRVIEDGEYVCSECGLVHGQILVSKDANPYSRNTEDDYLREHREIKMMRKQIQKELRKEGFKQIRLYKRTHEIAKVYCKKHGFFMTDFISAAIVLAVNQELKLEEY